MKARQGYKLVKLSNLSQTKETSIPDDWLVKRIEEIGEKDPETIDESKYEYSEIEYIDIGAIADFKITKTEKISLKDRPSRAQKIVRKDDVIISTVRPYLRSFTTIDNETKNLVCSTGFAVIRAKDSVLSQLIFSNTQSHHFNTQMIRLMQGSNYPAVTSDIVGNVMIPYPPDKKEREKIASILSNVDAQLQQTQKLIDPTQRLKKGLMQKLLTKGVGHTKFKKIRLFPRYDTELIPENWNVGSVDSLLKIIDYRGRTPPFSEEGIPHLRSNNIRDNKINFDEITYVTKEIYDEYMIRGIPKENDVLFTTEGPLGETTLIPKNFTFSLAQRIIVLRPKTSELDPKFLKYILDSHMIKKRYEGLATGTTLSGIASKWFTKLLLVYPSGIIEQQKIASILSNVDEQIQQHKNEKALLERLKKGLMQQLLTGQRRVKVGV